jgi:DHA1 family putative efflux transporter-like MFS transporter
MKRTSVALLVFTLMNFVLAMTALVFQGILDQVAVSLNISIADSGLLNTMYAYGAALGVPIVLIVFRKIERTRMLKIMLFVTILTTVALVLARDFGQLLVIRLVMGTTANSYGVLAVTAVVALSSKERLGRSMAFFVAGNSLALVIGVPLTRALSSVLDWRGIFWGLIGIMALSLAYFAGALPKGDHEATKLNLKREWGFLKDPRVGWIIAYTFLMFAGYGALYTYLTPYLLQLYPAMEGAMSLILVLLGTASFIGNLIGGHVSDRIGYAKSMLVGAALQVATVGLMLVCKPVGWLSVAFALLWIMSAWFTGIQLNTGIAQATRNESSFMLSLNSSAIQLGNAIGASLAAVVISLGGMESTALLALGAGVGILLIQWVSGRK